MDVWVEQVLTFYQTKDPGKRSEIRRWLDAQHEAWWEAWDEAEQFGHVQFGLRGVKAEWLWGYLNSSPLAWEVRLVNTVHDAYRSNDAHARARATDFLVGLQRVVASARAPLLQRICGFDATPAETAAATRWVSDEDDPT